MLSGAWRSIWRNAPRYTIDERDANDVGMIRIVTYNPDEPKPHEYGEVEFVFPEGAEAYRDFTGG
jgi:hypothetical protein